MKMRIFSLLIVMSLMVPIEAPPMAAGSAAVSPRSLAVAANGPTEATLPVPDARNETGTQVQVERAFDQLPLIFVENQGQMDEQVVYYIQGGDKTIYFTAEGVTFALTAPLTKTLSALTTDPLSRGREEPEVGVRGRWAVKLAFVGANPDARPVGEEQVETIVSYFKGPQEEWHTGLPTYARIVYRDLWPGIDLVYYGTVNQLKYEFVVHPGADPAQIRLAYRGATDVMLNAAGQMVVTTPLGGFTDDTPVAYQEIDGRRVIVDLDYRLAPSAGLTGDRTTFEGTSFTLQSLFYSFAVGAYDPTRLLVLDPAVLVYCGYIGGAGDDEASGIAVDGTGHTYIKGYTYSNETTFPVTVGPDLTFNGGYENVFVAKVQADGSGLVYAGFISSESCCMGVEGNLVQGGIAVDGTGNAYITGHTGSDETTFPVLNGPDLTYNGGSDVFVIKVRADGAGLVYAGYIGGAGEDWGVDIAVDGTGQAYVTGETRSNESTFPVVVGPDLTYNSGYTDAFVAKVQADGSGLVYAGYIGGTGQDVGVGIAVDGTGQAYVTGETYSGEATFPVVVGPDLTYSGGSDAFVAKVQADGAGLVYCGYIGSAGVDWGYGIAVDETGHVYVTGVTQSGGKPFPAVVGPYLTYNGGDADAFVAKVQADGAGLVYCGYIGGASSDGGNGIAVDRTGYAYVTGWTGSDEATFPVVGGPDLTYNGGYEDAFVAKVQADGAGLVYCGYIGGATYSYETGYDAAVDGAGSVYVAGVTSSDEATFPVVGGPDLTYNGGYDAFVAKVSAVGHTVSGRVRDAWNVGVSGVTISVGAAGSATTDSTGSYTITGLVTGTCTITAIKSGWTFVPSSRTVSVPPSATGQDFIGEESGSGTNLRISGYVRDYEGSPISGAIVSSDPGWGVAFTDVNGYYELDPLLSGVYVVTAMVGPYSLSPGARVVSVPPAAEQQNFTTVPQYGHLSGVVQEEGTLQPIKNARISIGGDVGFADDEGRYVLAEVLPGNHTLRVSASGYEPYEAPNFSVSENQTLVQDFPLQSIRSQDYYLPYPAGDSHMCTQGRGRDGSFSHLGDSRYAFDFGMETGDPVVASLEGRVVQIVEGYTKDKSCGESRCVPFANYVRIRHADGYDTLYDHLNYNSVTEHVELDQFVQRGQQIAESDNTGWTTGPHLDITRPKWGTFDSQPLAFADVQGDGVPVEGGVYTSSNYFVGAATARALTTDDVPPRGTVELILNGTPTHTLELRAFGYLSDVTEMKLASSGLGFEVADWVPYTTDVAWPHLAAYAQFRDGNGNLSEVVSDTVDAVGYESIDARFIVSPAVCVNGPLSITNQSTPFCEGCDWLWNFGNGVTNRVAEPQFGFSGQTSFYGYWEPGMYTVTLAVSNAFTTTSFSQTVQALPQPSARFAMAQLGNTITVEAEELEAQAWLWEFGDGSTGAGRTATHTYTNTSSLEAYYVRLTVVGPEGCTNSSHKLLSNPPTTLDVSGPTVGLVGESYTFTATANATATLPLTYTWSTENEAPVASVSDTQDTVVLSWTTPGCKTVVVTATNAGGTIATSHDIALYVPVQAGFVADPTTGPIPLTVIFTNTSTGDYITSLWDFGDGTTSTRQSPAHTYTNVGAYTVMLTAAGPGGSDMEVKPEYLTAEQPYIYLPLVIRNVQSTLGLRAR